jgi:hypothetical protein
MKAPNRRNLEDETNMTLTRILAAAGCAALLAGAAHAQSADSTTTTSVDQNDVQTTTTVDPTVTTTTTVDPTMGTTTTTVDPMAAPAATTAGVPASSMTMSETGAPGTVTTQVVTNGPIPDTAENRAKYGQPMSHAGKRTAPAGN